ncbi:MAG: GH92 family glycosyl hydrolase, partial [Phycisphaerae bacterium]
MAASSNHPLSSVTAVNPPTVAGRRAPAEYVDPFIGTTAGGNVFPGPSMPFGMVQLGPDTQGPGANYDYHNPDIQGFSMTHMSGDGSTAEGDVFFTATTGPLHTQVKNFQSNFSHSEESASPGYYRVNLLRWNINVQLTATMHCGAAKFTFPAGKQANILIPISHTLNYTTASKIDVV